MNYERKLKKIDTIAFVNDKPHTLLMNFICGIRYVAK